MADLIWVTVNPFLKAGIVAISDVHKGHPGGEVYLVGGDRGTWEVAVTDLVKMKLNNGDLIRVEPPVVEVVAPVAEPPVEEHEAEPTEPEAADAGGTSGDSAALAPVVRRRKAQGHKGG